MKKNPDISIIVPAYNAKNHLEKCLNSLINQTKQELEFIIINDGSTDNTEKIIKKYQNKDKRLKYFKNKNQGIGKTRNFGIEKATGTYLMFVDSDDYLEKDACEILYNKATKEELDLVICDFYRVINNKLEAEKLPSFPTTTLKKSPNLIREINLSPWNKLYKSSLIKDNNIKFVEDLKYEDAPFVCMALDKAKKIGKVDKCLNYYVIHSNSETTVRDNRIFDILKIVDIIRNYFKNQNYLQEDLNKLTVRIITNYTIQQRNQEDPLTAMNFINEAFSYLKKEIPDYKDNKYYESRSTMQKTIEKNKLLSKIYCKLYHFSKESLKQKLITIFFLVFALLFSFIIINNFFNLNEYRSIKINPLLMLLYLTITFLISYLLFKFIKSKVKHHKVLCLFFFIVLIGMQLLFAYIFTCDGLTWDFGTVYSIAASDASKQTAINYFDYLYAHPVNIGICLLLKYWYKFFIVIFNFKNYINLGIILNIIFIDLAVFYLYKIINNYFQTEKISFYLLLTILFTPLITYVPIFYTDTLSLPFGIMGIYYYLKGKDNKFFYILSGLLLGIGSCIKFTIFIILIAIILIHFFLNKNFIKILKISFILILGFLLPYLSYKYYIYKNFDSNKLEKISTPITHYVMMGLKGIGGYDYIEQEYTGKIIGIENKKKANIKVIKKRLKNKLENHTLLTHIANKTSFTWGDGSMFAPEELPKGQLKKHKMKDYILNKEKNTIFKTITQCEWYFILCLILIGILLRNYLNEKEQKLQFLLSVATFGVYIFFLIWETCSRYIVNFIPIFLLLAYLGIEAFCNYYKFKEEK